MSEEQPLPKSLRIDSAEKLAAAAEEQKAWATASPFASTSAADAERNRALVLIRDLEQGLIDLRWNKDFSPAEKEESRSSIKSRLAELYATLGDYGKAVSLEADKFKRGEYREILKAIDRDDAETCNCPHQMGDIELSNTYVKQDVWSKKHGRLMPVIACRACGLLNVRDLPIEQARLRAARRRARDLVGNADKARAKDILTREKLTTKNII